MSENKEFPDNAENCLVNLIKTRQCCMEVRIRALRLDTNPVPMTTEFTDERQVLSLPASQIMLKSGLIWRDTLHEWNEATSFWEATRSCAEETVRAARAEFKKAVEPLDNFIDLVMNFNLDGKFWRFEV